MTASQPETLPNMLRPLLLPFLLATCLMAGWSTAAAQDARPVALSETSSMRIDGTSNKSDWSLTVDKVQGTVWIIDGQDGPRPDSVSFVTLPADFEGSKSTIMTRLMNDALNTSEHPEITYSVGPSGIIEAAAGDTASWHTNGFLTVSGVTDTVYATVQGFAGADDTYVFRGTHRMSMKDHGIEPPTAMFGSLRTSEWVEIEFELVTVP